MYESLSLAQIYHLHWYVHIYSQKSQHFTGK